MTDRKTITVDADVFAEAKANKGERTWAELFLDGAHADSSAERQDERHAEPLTADDVPMLRREIADELENRMTRR
jgi:hypothetical protein